MNLENRCNSNEVGLLSRRLEMGFSFLRKYQEVVLVDNYPSEYFVERVANLSHANGVFRVTFAQNEDGDELKPTVRLIIPGNQLSAILQGLANAAQNIGEQVQARGGGQGEKRQVPTRQASKRQAPKRQAPKRQAPKRQAPKQQATKRQAPKQQAPKRQAPKQQAPKRQAARKSSVPKRNAKAPSK